MPRSARAEGGTSCASRRWDLRSLASPVKTAFKKSSVGRQKPAQIRGEHGSNGLGVNSSRLNGIDGAFLPKTAV